MFIYKGYYGKWAVDWDLVAFLDPDYAKKYLTTNNPCNNTSVDIDVEEASEWMRQRLEANRLTHVEHRAVVTHEYDRYIQQNNLSDEDKAVLDLVHTHAAVAPVTPHRIQGVAEIRRVDDEDATEDDVVCETSTSARRERVRAKSNYRYGTYFTSHAHSAVKLINPPAPTTPLLPIPKNFLMSGSTIKDNDERQHTIHQHKYLDDHSSLICMFFMEDETFLKLVVYHFALNKVYNTPKITNVGKKRLVFNKNTGNLFVISWDREKRAKKGKPHQKINGITTQLSFLSMRVCAFETMHLIKFARRLFEVTRDKIGGTPVYNPTSRPANYFVPKQMSIVQFMIACLWQFKVGQRLRWIDESLLDAVTCVHEAWATYGKNTARETLLEKFFAKPKSKRLFVKLRKKPHPTTLFKALLGEAYSNTVYKLVSLIPDQPHNLIHFVGLMFQNKMLYHFVSNLISWSREKEDVKEIIKNLMAAGHDLTFRLNTEQNSSTFGKFIKALKMQLANISNEPNILKWELFRDTIDMADRYNISINTNQLGKYEVVRELHDRFVGFINRDQSVQEELANIEFVEFPHPTKEYKGFTFQFLKNAEELVEEGRNMKHCVGAYGHRCVSGRSIIFSMRKDGVGFVTLELDGDDFNLRILQKYTRHDVTITNPEILDVINQWHNDVRQLNKDKTYAYKCGLIARYVSNIITLIDNSIPDNMKIPLRASVIQDDKIIDTVGLREYVKRVLVNNQDIARNIQTPNHFELAYNVPAVRVPANPAQIPVIALPNNAEEIRLLAKQLRGPVNEERGAENG